MTTMSHAVSRVAAALAARPIVAILRHLPPQRAADVGRVLVEEGIRVIEVPLNDQASALKSIEILADACGAGIAIGAGTVTVPAQVVQVRDAGGVLVVSPDTNLHVLTEAVAHGLFTIPGAATPTEVFTALRYGAGAVKLFPGSALGAAGLTALRDVVPNGTRLIPVGGVDADNAPIWRRAGAAGIGVGASIFRPDFDLDDIRARAAAIVHAWSEADCD